VSEIFTLSEWDSTDPLELSDIAVDFLKEEVNDGVKKIKVDFQREGQVILRSTSYVGTIALPDGPTIEIRPKAAGSNLINLLRYAKDPELSLIKEESQLVEGKPIIDPIALLYLEELKKVITHGIRKTYRWKSSSEAFLKGQLNVQRQIRKQPFDKTDFECDYEVLTYDNTENQSILCASMILSSLTTLSEVESELRHFGKLLRKRVTLRNVRPYEVQGITLNRLNEYYSTILSLSATVLRNIFIGELESGEQESYSLLIDMNRIFEQVVERAVKSAFPINEGWKVKTQENTQNLLEGKPEVTLRPDVVLERNDNTVVVADAKWKTPKNKPQNLDIYQIVSYQLAEDALGILVYPDSENSVKNQYYVKTTEDLKITQLPVGRHFETYDEWKDMLTEHVRREFRP